MWRVEFVLRYDLDTPSSTSYAKDSNPPFHMREMHYPLCPRKVYFVCSLPSPPPSSILSSKIQLTRILVKFRPKFLESRRIGLEYFLKYARSLPFQKQRYYRIAMIQLTSNVLLSSCVLLNPEFSSSPIVKDFLFGRLS